MSIYIIKKNNLGRETLWVWARLFITLVPKVFIFSYLLAGLPWGLLLNLIGWLIKLCVQTIQPLIVIVILCIIIEDVINLSAIVLSL